MTATARRHAVARAVAPACLLALAAALAPVPAGAWSAPGHRVVGTVAEQLLSGDARRELRALAGDETLAETGLWLDEQRDRLRDEIPDSWKWHFDNRPVCAPDAARATWCPDGQCASGQYERWRRVLGDRNASREQRLFALRVVVHLVGDVHQPLHAGDNGDRGGNDVNVGWGGRDEVRNLHRLWDRELVDQAMRGDSERRFATRLVSERRRQVASLQRGSFEEWMDESYRLSRELAYGGIGAFRCGERLPFVARLTPDYRDAAARAIRERIARAGIRLASELNRTLAPR